MASVREIAKSAGVSITTVSRVLNNQPHVSEGVRERVLNAANESRYIPAYGRRSNTNVGFVYTGEPSLGSPFDAAVLRGVHHEVEIAGLDLMILNARRARAATENFSQMFMRKGVRGALLRTIASSRTLCETIALEGFPVVVVGDRFQNPAISYVYCDSRDTSREAVEHLVHLGHRRIAVCMHMVPDSDHEDRLEGYKQVLAAHGIPLDQKLVMRAAAEREGGIQAIRRIMCMPQRCTALYCTDPAIALGAFGEARAAGLRAPEDLSIVGFDDADARLAVWPRMTAVCQDAIALGREAMRALSALLDQEGPLQPVRRALRTTFEIGDSTAPPSASA
jgi:LacI family repressor for deo operon, udp, cdd, tsx, nupC, and nupG